MRVGMRFWKVVLGVLIVLEVIAVHLVVGSMTLQVVADARLRCDHPKSALRAAQGAAMLLPVYGRPHAIMARAYSDMSEGERALQEARIAVRMEPGVSDYRVLLGDLLWQGGSTQEATRVYQDAAARAPWDMKVHVHLASALVATERFPDALSELGKLWTYNWDSRCAARDLVTSLRETGRASQAVALQDMLLSLSPEPSSLRITLESSDIAPRFNPSGQGRP